MAEIEVDAGALAGMAKDIEKAGRRLLSRAAERGYQLLRDEVPVNTGNLKQGVGPPVVNFDRMEATLTVSAHSPARGERAATLHLANGKTREIKLRPTKAYNYADVVARGNQAATLRPKQAKAFLIPVGTPPRDGSFISLSTKEGTEYFIVRRTRKGQKPNPYDERAARRLEGEIPKMWDETVKKYFQ